MNLRLPPPLVDFVLGPPGHLRVRVSQTLLSLVVFTAFAGVLHGPGSARPLIETLTHRGPDGVRVEQARDASLAHARLSIIDLEGGWQPLHAAGSTVIGNGEVYNYIELAEEFGLKDHLSTGSDFEPLLHIYAQEGPAAFDLQRGRQPVPNPW